MLGERLKDRVLDVPFVPLLIGLQSLHDLFIDQVGLFEERPEVVGGPIAEASRWRSLDA